MIGELVTIKITKGGEVSELDAFFVNQDGNNPHAQNAF
jgi:hypothetical protein